MRLIFAGTPAAAIPSLDALAADHDISAVLTRADSPQGRKRVLTPSVVAERAEALALRTVRANRITDDLLLTLDAGSADLGVIVAYGAILREPLLSQPRFGWINLHFSLLPRWRGAAPVQRALIAGDEVTGVSVFQLVPQLDAGSLFAVAEYRPGAHQSAGQLLDALAELGAHTLTRVVEQIAAGTAVAVDQIGEPTAAPKLTIEDAMLKFDDDCASLYNRFRGVTPEPGAYGMLDGEPVKILELEPLRDGPRQDPGQIRMHERAVLVGTSTEPLHLVTVQPAGKRPMPAADWWRGLRQKEVRFDG